MGNNTNESAGAHVSAKAASVVDWVLIFVLLTAMLGFGPLDTIVGTQKTKQLQVAEIQP